MNPYHVLGVPPNADIAALQAAYRKLARLHHPDLAQGDEARRLASERMVKINWAWHIVSDDGRRAAFDAQLRAQQLESARRQQEAFRAQANGQVVRGGQAHLNDVLKAQATRRQQQNRERQPQGGEQQAAQDSARAQQFLEQQAAERARLEREARVKQELVRPVRKRLTREEKKRQALARARLRRMRREDRRRSATPSARRQLAEAARLFGQEGRAGDAIAICHDVLRVDFRNVPARELLGDFYLRLGREDRALPLWEQALVLQPDNASVRRKLNALHPHDHNSYAPRPSRSAPPRERVVIPSGRARDSFWGRLRSALRGGL